MSENILTKEIAKQFLASPNQVELQMFSERRRERHDKAGQTVYEWHRVGKRDNHLWDCEGMQVAAAMMAKCLAETA